MTIIFDILIMVAGLLIGIFTDLFVLPLTMITAPMPKYVFNLIKEKKP